MSTKDSANPAPDQVLASHDPGDETARRYRFQYTWAAIDCCMLLDETQDVVEVFCEHHEDILIKHRNNTFTGEQVKTRESNQPIWKASDPQVMGAFARFAQMEDQYPDHFCAYRFLTNHPLYVAKNAQSLGYIIATIAKAQALSDLPSNASTWVKRIARDAKVTESVAFQALKKCSATDKLPKLTDSHMRLIQTLVECWPTASDCVHTSVSRAAHSLIDECARASSLDHEQLLPAYIISNEAQEVKVLSRIHGKRITVDRLLAILDDGINAPAPLSGEPSKWIEPGQGSTDLMFKKLDAGGFSAVSRSSAENLRDKADYLGITWTKKLGRDKGLERYDHIRSIALTDAARAFENTKSHGDPFGPTMQKDLLERFQKRKAQGEQLFDCSIEHLEGFTYSLTSQCKVQWSIDRPWEDD